MIIKRIVSNIAVDDTSKAHHFYVDVLGLEVSMDHGWFVTFASAEQMTPEVSIAREGGSGTSVPDLSIEVDDLDDALRRFGTSDIEIENGPVSEDWGVRRFTSEIPSAA